MAVDWVSLHHHSTYSFLDGYGTVEQHVERAVEIGMPALALTEHGNISSHVSLEKACNKLGIKPIFGVELYTGDVDEATRSKYKWHLTVLAENEVGYRNLLQLVTKGWHEGFYYEPTVSGAMLAEHREGLVVLSGCSSSKLAVDLLGGKGTPEHKADVKSGMRTAARFKALLGDNYYLEAQAFPELDRTVAMNETIARISERLHIPVVATGDVHYMRPNDSAMQVVLHAAGRGNQTVEKQLQTWGYDVKLSPPLDIERRMRAAGLSPSLAAESVGNTLEIASRCSVTLPKHEPLRYPTPDGVSAEDLMWQWLRRGWEYRWQRNPNMRVHKWEYVERLRYEMELIVGKNYMDYFLMLSDAVRWAKDRGIPVGPARGSAAASLACYLLRITEVDPVPFPIMLFERFIDINRTDLPDVDLDFDDERREDVRQYLIEKYGSDKVGNLGTFVKYKGRNSLIDVARVNNIPMYDVEIVKDLLVERSGGDSRAESTIADTIDMFPAAKAVFEKHPKLLQALQLEGNIRGMGIHAAGLVIGNAPLTDTAALYKRKSKDRELSVLSVDKYDAEYLGLLKADFLGLSTMGMIRIALEVIDMELDDLYSIPLDDPVTLDGFNRGDVTGIFQFSGGTTRIVNHDVKPDTFLELCDINALARPGPLHSGTTQEYINVKHGKAKPTHLHPIVDAVTSLTKYQIIYQEQVLQILREMGGLPWAHIQEIRKIISLKKGEGAFNEKLEPFLQGAQERHGISRELALAVWRRLVTSGQYAFNASHCVGYSMLAYWQMWLKQHYPLAFYVASLQKDPTSTLDLLKDARRHGVQMLSLDLNKSTETWSVDGDAMRAGFVQVPGIGEKYAFLIVSDRMRNGDFTDWEDVKRIKGVGPKMASQLRAFAEDPDPFNIDRLAKMLDGVRAELPALGLPYPTHTAEEIDGALDGKPLTWIGICVQRNPQDVLEDQRARTGESYEEVIARTKRPDLSKKMSIVAADDTGTVFLRVDRFRFPRYAKALWGIKLNKDVVLVRGLKQAGFGKGIQIRDIVVLSPEEE